MGHGLGGNDLMAGIQVENEGILLFVDIEPFDNLGRVFGRAYGKILWFFPYPFLLDSSLSVSGHTVLALVTVLLD